MDRNRPLTAPAANDLLHPFLLENLDIRGAHLRLGAAWRDMTAGRDYPAPTLRLLGEMAAVTVLIGGNLKQPGRMRFQLKGTGPVDLLVLDCTQELQLRGMARSRPDIQEAPVPELLGDGRLALILDMPQLEQPYQSLVPLMGDSLAAIFEHYLGQSEQQPTRLFLAADADGVAGLLLQKLPDADQRDADGWQRVQSLAETLRPHELLGLDATQLLTRVFPEEDIRLFPPRPVTYHCPRDWEKVAGMLRAMGRAECDTILREEGEIHIHDEICDQHYRLDGATVAALLDGPAATVH